MSLWFRWGAPRQVRHMTYAVWASDDTVYLTGSEVLGMYGVGFGPHFLGLILAGPHDATEFDYDKTEDAAQVLEAA